LIWNSVIDNIFEVVLNEKFELSILTHWICLIIIAIQPCVICFIFNIKLNGVISGSDGFDIPVDEAQFLAVVNVINIKNTEEENEKHKG